MPQDRIKDTKPTRGRPRQYGDNVRRRIGELKKLGFSSDAISQRLMDEGMDAPDTRTIDRIARQEGGRDPSAPWSLLRATPTEAALVPPVLAEIVSLSAGERTYLTENEARWIALVRRAAPDLLPLQVFEVVYAYLGREQKGRDMRDLDAFLSFAPWRSAEFYRRYSRAAGLKGEHDLLWLELNILGSWTGTIPNIKPTLARIHEAGLEIPKGER